MARAEDDSSIASYAERYKQSARAMGFHPDWSLFMTLWRNRHNSSEDMAALVAEVMAVAYDEVLAWIEGRDTP